MARAEVPFQANGSPLFTPDFRPKEPKPLGLFSWAQCLFLVEALLQPKGGDHLLSRSRQALAVDKNVIAAAKP